MDLYEAIFKRRDIRKFRPDPLPEDALGRILKAAHHAASVGFMQPWNFILVRDPERRAQVKESFEIQNRAAAEKYSGAKRALYKSLKLEGILESPLNICVTCDRGRGGEVLGRSSIYDTDLFSTCCAVQNLWLAARAEGIGVGWVSIVDNERLSAILEIPAGVVPLAYLCVGYPESFPEEPMLETEGWRARMPLEELVFRDKYGQA
ncbi:MAG TPA: 5,6-dimethylbenzimidazole synthase [bacterium]|jgi:5,6-dimethylbenzimidazole synthase|nr:5,6-dimethylbenzimidazole synthase [bacterium]